MRGIRSVQHQAAHCRNPLMPNRPLTRISIRHVGHPFRFKQPRVFGGLDRDCDVSTKVIVGNPKVEDLALHVVVIGAIVAHSIREFSQWR